MKKDKSKVSSISNDSSLVDILKNVTGNPLIIPGNSEDNVTKNFISTGNILLDYQISSGGGIPENKVTEVVGPFASAKTFLCSSIAKNGINGNTLTREKYKIAWFEGEGSTSKSELKIFGWTEEDLEQIFWIPIESVEKLKRQLYKMLDAIQEKKIKDKFIIIADSLGNLGSEKEIDSALGENDAADMTRAKAVKSLFRLIPKKAEIAETPIIIINHIYKSQSFIPMTIVGGGQGATLGPHHIIELSKSKLKKGDKQIGIEVNSKILKSRTTKADTKISIPLTYEKGMEYYGGLDDFCKENKIDMDFGNLDSVKSKLQEYFSLNERIIDGD